MNQKLTIFTCITPSYQYSAELALCFDWLRQSLPNDARWVVQEGGDDEDFRQTVIQNWPANGERVLIVREPAMLVDKRVFSEMSQILDSHPQIIAVMPSDTRGTRPGYEARYFSLRGFERFAATLFDPAQPIAPYDNRDAWMVLLRSEKVPPENLPQKILDVPHGMHSEQVALAMNAYIHPFFNYYREKREDLLPFVPKGISSLLDIGCSRGGFGSLVKQTMGCRVVGAEMNSFEAETAQQVLDHVWVGDVLGLEINEKFDCISCLDVIEHLAEPRKLLAKVKSLLSPGGKFLLSVPNVGHWSVVEDLMAGRWDYLPAGILCNTHLRFYTETSIRKLLEESGFSSLEIQRQEASLPPSLEKRFLDIREHGIEVDLSSLSTLGFVVLASVNS